MKKFIVLYHAPAEATQQMAGKSPEEMKEGMEPWMRWAQKCGDGLVDMGAPLTNAQVVTKHGVSASGTDVLGYSVLQAESMDDAVAMLKEHPHLEWMDACSVEVYETLPLPGM